MSEDMNIQWFPGHMTKARRMIAEQVKLVDAVCEIIDGERVEYFGSSEAYYWYRDHSLVLHA